MSSPKRYLCFNLGKEEFSIPLLSVREVLGMPEVTPVPQSPPHFIGIMNLRGQVISVMDLRLKLGVKAIPSEETAVIILDWGNSGLGLVVDKVNAVLEIEEKDIAAKPSLDNAKCSEYITGVYKRHEQLILLIDVTKALSLEDKTVASKNASKAA